MTWTEHEAQGEWFDAVVARMLALDPALGPESAIDTVAEVARLPRWRELSPELAAHRAVVRLAARKEVRAPAQPIGLAA